MGNAQSGSVETTKQKDKEKEKEKTPGTEDDKEAKRKHRKRKKGHHHDLPPDPQPLPQVLTEYNQTGERTIFGSKQSAKYSIKSNFKHFSLLRKKYKATQDNLYSVPSYAERPSTPSRPEVFQENAQFVLRWDPPAFDGHCPIIGYVIQHLELGLPSLNTSVDDTSQWYSSEPGQVTQTECLLNNLIPGTTYMFRILAENLLGYSEPSLVSNPIVYNPNGELDDWFSKPKMTQELEEVYQAIEHERLSFSVQVEGQPYALAHWFNSQNAEITSALHPSLEVNPNYIVTSSGFKRILTIQNVSLKDAGTIRCVLENELGTMESSTTLIVESPPRIHHRSILSQQSQFNNEKVYEDLNLLGEGSESGKGDQEADSYLSRNNLIFQAGQMIRLKFVYSGHPEPTVGCFHDDIEINPDSSTDEFQNVEFHTANNEVVLRILNAKRSNRGEYTIRLENVLGEDSTQFLITITDRPCPPPQPPELLQLSDNSCLLQWKAPEDDGGCPISNYIIEYFRSEWGIWLKGVSTRGTATKLRDLIPGSKYKFRIKAENLYGVSDPSPESVEILVTDVPSARSENEGFLKTLAEEEDQSTSRENLVKSQTLAIPENIEEESLLEPIAGLKSEKLEMTQGLEPPRRRPKGIPTIPILETETKRISPLPIVKVHAATSTSPRLQPKKLYSRTDVLGIPYNFGSGRDEVGGQTSPVSNTTRQDEMEIERLKDYLSQIDKDDEVVPGHDSDEEEGELELSEIDFDKLQREYDEDSSRSDRILGKEKVAAAAEKEMDTGPQYSNQLSPEERQRLPVFKQLTERYNELEAEVNRVLQEQSEKMNSMTRDIARSVPSPTHTTAPSSAFSSKQVSVEEPQDYEPRSPSSSDSKEEEPEPEPEPEEYVPRGYTTTRAQRSTSMEPILHDRFTDYLTMKVMSQNSRIGSSLSSLRARTSSLTSGSSSPSSSMRSSMASVISAPTASRGGMGTMDKPWDKPTSYGTCETSARSSDIQSRQPRRFSPVSESSMIEKRPLSPEELAIPEERNRTLNRSPAPEREIHPSPVQTLKREPPAAATSSTSPSMLTVPHSRALESQSSEEEIVFDPDDPDDLDLVITECSLTVPVTMRQGSKIEVWRCDTPLAQSPCMSPILLASPGSGSMARNQKVPTEEEIAKCLQEKRLLQRSPVPFTSSVSQPQQQQSYKSTIPKPDVQPAPMAPQFQLRQPHPPQPSKQPVLPKLEFQPSTVSQLRQSPKLEDRTASTSFHRVKVEEGKGHESIVPPPLPPRPRPRRPAPGDSSLYIRHVEDMEEDEVLYLMDEPEPTTTPLKSHHDSSDWKSVVLAQGTLDTLDPQAVEDSREMAALDNSNRTYSNTLLRTSVYILFSPLLFINLYFSLALIVTLLLLNRYFR